MHVLVKWLSSFILPRDHGAVLSVVMNTVRSRIDNQEQWKWNGSSNRRLARQLYIIIKIIMIVIVSTAMQSFLWPFYYFIFVQTVKRGGTPSGENEGMTKARVKAGPAALCPLMCYWHTGFDILTVKIIVWWKSWSRFLGIVACDALIFWRLWSLLALLLILLLVDPKPNL